MRKLFTILFFICSSLLSKSQQTIDYKPQNQNYSYPYVRLDSGVCVPFRDTSTGRGTTRPGSIVCRPADSLFYGYNGKYWAVIGADVAALIAKINLKVDSVTLNSDTLYYWVQGVGYGYLFPSVGSLQQVTRIGNYTTDSLITGGGLILRDIESNDSVVNIYEQDNKGVVEVIQRTGGNNHATLHPDYIELKNGDQGLGKTLVSDNSGKATWQYSVTTVIDSAFTFPSGTLIEKVEVIEPTDILYNIGTTLGGVEIATNIPVTTGYGNFEFDYYTTASTTIYFSNVTTNTIIKIYSR